MGLQPRAWQAVVACIALVILLMASPALDAPGASAAGGLPASCAGVRKAAGKILAADDAFLNATQTRVQNAAFDREDAAIDRLRRALPGCDVSAVSPACSGLVTTAAKVVATDDEYDRAQDSNAEDAAMDAQWAAIAELDVGLEDCRAGALPEPCAASVRAANDVVRADAQYQKARGEKADNVALTNQDRAIAALKVRLEGCNATPSAAACSAVLTVGQQIVDAEDRFHTAATDAETDAALDQELDAIDELESAVATCPVGPSDDSSRTPSSKPSGQTSRKSDDPDLADELFGDTYVADLTRGKGDFVAKRVGATSTRYVTDGYRVTMRAPDSWAPIPLKTKLSHTVLSVAVKVDLGAAPADASFGPFCWQDPDHGYGIVLSTSGNAELVRVNGSYNRVKVLASSTTALPADKVTLMVTCVRTKPLGNADVRLGGYLGNQKILEASAPAVEDFEFTGFSGYAGTTVPAEWTITHFERRGPDDLPADAPR